MIAFACAISETEPYRRYAEPGITRAREPGSKLLAFAAVDTITRSYNILLEAAAALPDLEALVIVSPFAEITDSELCAKVRLGLSDPEVAVAGCVGARGVQSIAWWDGTQVSCARGFVYAYNDKGGGELPGLPWVQTGPAPAEVDAVDGSLLILSPWAVANLRFDETLSLGHGFDVDYCLQARRAGHKVMTLDIAVREHRSLKIVGDLEVWTEAHVAFARKWWGRMPGREPTPDAEALARRMEAEREAARSMSYFRRLSFDARLEPHERELKAAMDTLSWRVTEPLRRLNHWRGERRARPSSLAR